MKSSTGNILDVAPQQEHPTKAVNHEGRNAVVVGVKPGAGCGVKSPAENNSDTNPIRHNSIALRGVAVSPAAPQVLEVADQATGNAPVTDGLQVGDEGVSNCGEPAESELNKAAEISGPLPEVVLKTPLLRNEQLPDSQFPTDDRYADNISRFVDSRLERNGL